jgi:hypothetical protein
LRPALVARAVRDELGRRAPPRLELLAVVVGHREGEVQLAVAHLRFVVGRRGLDDGALSLQKGDQARRILRARHRHRQRLILAHPGSDQREHGQEADRPEDGHEQAREDRAPIAQVILQLLAKDGQDHWSSP